jgi:hypothetical protein
MNSEEGRQTTHQRPVGLTITVEKIDRVLTDIRAQIEFIRPFSRPRDHSHWIALRMWSGSSMSINALKYRARVWISGNPQSQRISRLSDRCPMTCENREPNRQAKPRGPEEPKRVPMYGGVWASCRPDSAAHFLDRQTVTSLQPSQHFSPHLGFCPQHSCIIVVFVVNAMAIQIAILNAVPVFMPCSSWYGSGVYGVCWWRFPSQGL